MPRRLSPENQLELDRLRTELGTIVGVLERDLDQPLMFTDVIENTHAAQNLRGLRMMAADVLGMLQVADAAQRKEIDALLRERTGRSLADFDTRAATRVERILKRGRITGEEQYFFVREYLERISTDSSQQTTVERLEQLLAAFAERAAAGTRGKRSERTAR